MGKSIGKTRVACILCAVALCFGIALAGCSSGSSSSAASGSASADSSASSAAASSESASASEDVASAAAATKGIIQNNDTSAAADFDALPTSDDADAVVLESGEVEEGTDDDAKAPSDATVLQTAGLKILVPKTWSVSTDADGYVFSNPEGTIDGYLFGFAKPVGEKIDVEGMVKAIPGTYAQMGYTDIEVLGFSDTYSAKGTLIGGEILFAGSIHGTQYLFYIAIVESANYINFVEIGGAAQDVYANLETLDAIITSVTFCAGEAI